MKNVLFFPSAPRPLISPFAVSHSLTLLSLISFYLTLSWRFVTISGPWSENAHPLQTRASASLPNRYAYRFFFSLFLLFAFSSARMVHFLFSLLTLHVFFLFIFLVLFIFYESLVGSCTRGVTCYHGFSFIGAAALKRKNTPSNFLFSFCPGGWWETVQS